MLKVKENLNDAQKERMQKINEAIALIVKDKEIKDIVNGIENGIKTTKGNYGKYMAFLSNFKDVTMLYIMSEALKELGADCYGVNWAVNLLKNRY